MYNSFSHFTRIIDNTKYSERGHTGVRDNDEDSQILYYMKQK